MDIVHFADMVIHFLNSVHFGVKDIFFNMVFLVFYNDMDFDLDVNSVDLQNTILDFIMKKNSF